MARLAFFPAILGAVLSPVGTAVAASPAGEWQVTFYEEDRLHRSATQVICFKADNTWYSATFGGWTGAWFQKGDRLRWYGHTDDDLATSFFGQFVANTLITGEYASFSTVGVIETSSLGNWSMRKLGASCRPAPASSAPSQAGPIRN